MATINKNLSEYNLPEDIAEVSAMRIGIVVAQWNKPITDNLLQGAKQTLEKAGLDTDNLVIWEVPGSYELVYSCHQMIKHENPDAIIAIGSVIQGETKHFDFVCQAISQGIKDLNLTTDTPVVFCVLTDDTQQQAEDRSGGRYGNKGVECALAALTMASLKKRLYHLR